VERGGKPTVAAQIAEREAATLLSRAPSETSEIPIQAPVGNRKRMRLILKDMSLSKSGKLQFLNKGESLTKRGLGTTVTSQTAGVAPSPDLPRAPTETSENSNPGACGD
jgi:hypothetical protein